MMPDLRVIFPKPCDESWDAMRPAGRTRDCARCATLVHDLSNYDVQEAEVLIRRERGVCVRAQVRADGTVALRARAGLRQMVATLGATVVLVTAPQATAKERPSGMITGTVWNTGVLRVTATNAAGAIFRKTVRGDQYRLKHLPAGTYTLSFEPDCGDAWTVTGVEVDSGETVVPENKQGSGCIIVGMIQLEQPDRVS